MSDVTELELLQKIEAHLSDLLEIFGGIAEAMSSMPFGPKITLPERTRG